MANPNIVSVTSIFGESICEALTTTVTTDIMTVASNKLLKINYIQVANDDGSTATAVTVAIVKAGFTSDGLPVGLQLVGRPQDDIGLLQLANAFEVETNFSKKRPSLIASL